MLKSGGAALCLFGREIVIVVLHSGGSVFLHLVAGVGIDVQGKAGGGMAQVRSHRLDVIAALNGGHSKAVPANRETAPPAYQALLRLP